MSFFNKFALLLLAALASMTAAGQDNGVDGDSDADERSGALQAEMVVTAEKREEPLRKTPQSVTALNAEFMEDAGVRDVEEASYYVPNLFVTGFAAKRTSFPYIRGMGSGQGEPVVTTYIDGVPQLTPNTTNIHFLDLQRVEVLRGPQGTLYGRNTIGGLVHYVSRQPDNQLRANVEFDFGDDSYNRQVGSISGPLVKDRVYFSAGLALSARDGFTQNGFLNDTVDDRDGDFGRFQLLFTPSQSWKVRVSAFGQRDRDGGFTLYDLDSLQVEPYQALFDYEGETNRDLRGTSATVNYYGSSFDVTGIVAFDSWDADERTDLDFTPVDLLRRKLTENLVGEPDPNQPAAAVDPDAFASRDRIRQALSELPEQQRVVFCLSRFDGLRYAEIAQVLGISVKTVEVHISRALKKLRDRLRDLATLLWLSLFW